MNIFTIAWYIKIFKAEFKLHVSFVCLSSDLHFVFSYFQVFVNDEYFAEFNHRCDMHDCHFFNMYGDMDILDVQYFETLVIMTYFSFLCHFKGDLCS